MSQTEHRGTEKSKNHQPLCAFVLKIGSHTSKHIGGKDLTTDVQTTIDLDALLGQMTLAEKIGQMTQVEKNSITPGDVRDHAIGSILSGGGGNPTPNNPMAWRAMVTDFIEASLASRLKIPLLYGVDAVHGHANMRGATVFPHNIGLGASRNPNLMRQIAAATASEMLAVNVRWNFAPALSVPQDVRWGRTYEGYGDNPELVTEMATAYTQGLIDAGVLPSIKHYVADGGTEWNTTQHAEWINAINQQAATTAFHIDQGDARIDEATLRSLHLAPYKAAIDAGALNLMASFSSWNGTKMHANRYLLTDVLRGELGFSGFVVSDWMAIDQIDPDFYTAVVTCINAGIDMVMVPYDWLRFIDTLTDAVHKGDVAEARIDEAVTRILHVKQVLGLFEQPHTDAALVEAVNNADHRALARQAATETLVLLKHENSALPIAHAVAHILVGGAGADDLGMQCGGWTIEWQGFLGRLTEGTTLLQALTERYGADRISHQKSSRHMMMSAVRYPLGIAVVGEAPYAEGFGDRPDVTLSPEDQMLIRTMRERVEKLVVVQLTGRPQIISDVIDVADAWVCAWWPGSEGGPALLDALTGIAPFTGKLPHALPRSMAQVPRSALLADAQGPLFPYGHGLTL